MKKDSRIRRPCTKCIGGQLVFTKKGNMQWGVCEKCGSTQIVLTKPR